MKFAALMVAISVPVLATWMLPAHATPQQWALAQAQDDIGADKATAIARDVTGGRVLGVRRLDDGGHVVYEIKVLLEGGLVRTLQVDGGSGAVL